MEAGDPRAAGRAASPIAVRVRRRGSTSSGVTSDEGGSPPPPPPPPDRRLQRRGTGDEEREALLQSRHAVVPPRDNYNTVYAVFYLLGMGTLLPWNFFISVKSFWDYKFRNVSLENATVIGANISSKSVPPRQTELQKEFTSYLAIASNVPNAVCVILNALFGQQFQLKFRIFISLGTIIVLFFIITVLAKANSDDWQREFLEFVLVLVVLINCCTAVYQGGVFGVAGKFPSRYISSVMAGQAMGGIFPAVVDIGVVSFAIPDQDVGFYCFLTATILLIVCFLAFSWIRRVDFFKYYAGSSNEQQRTMVQEQSIINHERNGNVRQDMQWRQHRRHSVISLMHHSWQYCLSVYLVFVVTLSVFPAVTVLVQSTQGPSIWTERYFTPVTCFLLFNVGDYAGRVLASWILRPKGRGSQNITLLILSLVRVIFVPIFMLCNASGSQRHLPVIFTSDAAYIIFVAIFAISNGYLGNLCMVLGPKSFSDGRDQELCAMVLVACLVLGTGSGSFLSYPIVSSI